jgi:hypothetical protein
MYKPVIGCIGDSNCASTDITSHSNSGTYVNTYPKFHNRQGNSLISWTVAYSDGLLSWREVYDPGHTLGYRFHSGVNGGYGSASSQETLDRLERYYKRVRPDIVICQYGSFDIDQGPSTSAADVDAIDALVCSYLLSMGAIVVYPSIPGRIPDTEPVVNPQPVGWPNGDARYARRIALNNYRSARAAANPGQVFFIDMESDWIDSVTGWWKTGMSEDRAHMSAIAAQIAGKKTWTAIASLILGRTSSENFHYSYENYNFAVNPLFTGSGGILKSGHGLTGAIPTDWTLERAGSNHTCAASIITSVGVPTKVRLSITPGGPTTAGNEAHTMHQLIDRPLEPDGTLFTFRFKASWGAFGGMRGVTSQINIVDGGANLHSRRGLSNRDPSIYPWATTGSNGIVTVESPPVALQAATTHLSLRHIVYTSNQWNPGSSLAIDLSEAKCAPYQECIFIS